ncbi:molybdopterin converting factor subunit 1 [Streptomyces thermocarboxydovorans]|uniref:Molybdopterin converting factor subunit 1 n=1 Tax=Streptomyces thermocarboxydovorans TaxID=59298 RepID=A0ABP3SV18_9ACTN
MQIRVLYFGALRERFVGTHQEDVTVTDGTTLGRLIDRLCHLHPGLEGVRRHVKAAVNEDFAPPERPLTDGDVVALIPPVAGGAEPYCRLTEQPLSVDEVLAAVTGPGQGGTVVFIGTVRDHSHGKQVTRLEYEAYPGMVLKTLADIIHRCQSIAAGVRVAVAHRTGRLEIGDAAVVIAASAPHRAEAFEASRMCIELLKEEVPIWKKEISPDGAEWIGMGP